MIKVSNVVALTRGDCQGLRVLDLSLRHGAIRALLNLRAQTAAIGSKPTCLGASLAATCLEIAARNWITQLVRVHRSVIK